jgi:TPR repeat protein
VLAAILLGLGYMAWRGTQGNSLSHEASPPPPAVAKEVATPPAQPADAQPADAAKAVPPAAAKNPADELPDRTPETTSKPEPKNTQHRPSKPTQAAESEKLAAPQRGTDKGEEELSIAERYLSGGNGRRRNTAEASTWLWRSVAKHNDKATLLLADLYLRGDGVSKNCDQARVLLDSAARKGMSGAGERLRNLQAFGCQ